MSEFEVSFSDASDESSGDDDDDDGIISSSWSMSMVSTLWTRA